MDKIITALLSSALILLCEVSSVALPASMPVDDGMIVFAWDGGGKQAKKLCADGTMGSNFNIWEGVTAEERNVPHLTKLQEYGREGLKLHAVGIATEGALKGRSLEYLKKYPDRRQWYYKWFRVKAEGSSVSIPLPEDIVKGEDYQYWFIKDTTDIFLPDGRILYEELHKKRRLPFREQWSIRDGKIVIKSSPGQYYTAYLPCQSGIPALLPTDYSEYVAHKLNLFLQTYREISYVTWEAIASMHCYLGDTWADCSPVMQKLYRKKTGFEFDPELVELDPFYWAHWIKIKADVVAQAISVISKVIHKNNAGHDYYIGDFTQGGSPETLGRVGVDNQLIWTNSWNGKWEGGGNQIPDWGWEFIWNKAFLGNWEKKPGYSHLYWVYNRDDRDAMLRWWWHLTLRGAINDSLPNKLWWGINTVQHKPKPHQLRAIREINLQYKFLYGLLKNFKPSYAATGYIPSLGTGYYSPSIFGLFTREGYLWDTPIKWKHLDLADLAQGRIPADCDLLLLPSEPFMSGLIDDKAVRKIRSWVEKGHSLLALRAASYTDIYGRDRGYAPLREITGVDYAKPAKHRLLSFNKTEAGLLHPIARSLSKRENIYNDRKWLVQFQNLKYEWWDRYYMPHPTAWFAGGQMSREMIRQLLPPWEEYSEAGAKPYRNLCKILCQDGETPLLSTRELGKGRVAYLGREYNLEYDFGHSLLAGIARWLTRSEEQIKTDDYHPDIALRSCKNDLLVLEYNPSQSETVTPVIRIPVTNFKNNRYVVLNFNLVEPLASRFLLKDAEDRYLWQKKDFANGYKVFLNSWQLGLQLIRPYYGLPLLFEHALLDPEMDIEAFSSLDVKFTNVERPARNRLRLSMELIDPLPPSLKLDYEPGHVEFPRGRIEVRIGKAQALSIGSENKLVAKFEKGKLNVLDKRWRGGHNPAKGIIFLERSDNE